MVESIQDTPHSGSHNSLPSLELGSHSHCVGSWIREDIAAGYDIADDWREEEACWINTLIR